jgi:hypothetical protein
MCRPRCVVNNKGTNENNVVKHNSFIKRGSVQLHVSATNVRHHQVVYRSC